MNSLEPGKHASPLKFFLAVNQAELKWLAFNIFFYDAGSAAILAAIYFLGRVVDSLIRGNSHVGPTLWLIILLLALYEAMYRLGHICEVILLSRVRGKIKKALFDHTTSLSFGYFADRFAGEIGHKVSATADAFERIILAVTNNFVEGGFLIILFAVTLGKIHPAYAVFVTAWLIVFLAGSFLLARRMNRLAGGYAEAEAKTGGAIIDLYGNISAVKVYGKKEQLQTAHDQIDRETRAFRAMGRWDIITFNFQGTAIVALSAGLIAITARLYGHNLISLGAIVFIAGSAIRLYEFIWDTGKNLAAFIRFRGEAAQNLGDLVVAPAVVDGSHTAPKNEQVGVEYREVGFSYINERPVLDNFSLIVKPKEKVGIVGLSGAGKTTFANLLLRFFDPQSGSILLNGADIKNFTQEFLRSHISYISQDTSLFHTTVAENIAYGSPAASPEQIEHAARLAYADEFIQTLPQGYQSIVGDRGIKLSGGQRQRVAIARALLADRPLFLLDEATSALDSDSESKIQKGLTALMENKTVIAIAHRLSTLSHMDRIIFLEDGQIVEDGTHSQLLAQKGKYAQLWQMQAGGFLPSVASL